MPLRAIDYSKTIIYKIVCNDLSIKECYVGHTTGFVDRKRNHKKSVSNPSCREYGCRKSVFIREHGGWENWEMIEIEKYPCKDRNEAAARERYWYEELNAQLNMRFPTRSDKEWREDNREYWLQKKKEYYEVNRVELLQKKKEYYEANKDEIAEKKKALYTCECGITSTILHKARHEKSTRHKKLISAKSIDATTNQATISSPSFAYRVSS